jgi:exodeoxyribonuclease VII large subunit
MAGRLVVPELSQLCGELDRAHASLTRSLRRLLERDEQRIGRTRDDVRRALRTLLARDRERLGHARERLRAAPALTVERKRAVLEGLGGRLRALSPLATLQRGYAVVRTDNGNVLLTAAGVSGGDRVTVELGDGMFGARVE